MDVGDRRHDSTDGRMESFKLMTADLRQWHSSLAIFCRGNDGRLAYLL